MKTTLFKLRNHIFKENIKDIFFVDSYGGIKNFFDLYNEFGVSKRAKLILCSNVDVYNFISSIDEFKKITFVYTPGKMMLKDFVLKSYFLIFRPSFKKVERIFSYKFVTDPFKFFLINLIASKKTKLYIEDQFWHYYNFKVSMYKNEIIYKKIVLNLLNILCKVKLNLYKHFEFDYGYYPCLDKKFKYRSQNKSWQYYQKKYFKQKIQIKKNSLIIIDETLNLLVKNNWLITTNLKNNLNFKINKFLKKYKISSIYYKPHPTSKIGSYLINNLNFKKKIINLDKKYPIEFFLNKFDYCIFSISSALWFSSSVKFFSLNNLLEFKKTSYKRKYFNLFKKNLGNNFYKNL